MIHASVELVEAMRGECPVFPFEPPNNSGPHARQACLPGVTASERIIWGYARGQSEDSWRPVDCPACFALMAEARGPERTADLLVYADHLEGVVAALDAVVAEGPAPEMTTAERTAILRSHNIARSKLRAIQSANLFVPGESAARRKTA